MAMQQDDVCMHAEVCLGLYVLHTNKILHRDIKAANIFVGDNDCIKVHQPPTCQQRRSADSRPPCSSSQ